MRNKQQARSRSSTLAEISRKDSPRIRRLRREAQSVLRVPIKDIPLPLASGETQGKNRPSADGTSWEVYHMVGPSKDYNDALLAHELSHIILNSKGFNPLFGLKSGQGAESETALILIARQIGPDCFPDELIDRETVKRGFKPSLLLERQMHLTEQGLIPYEIGEFESSSDLNKTFVAVTLFCIGKRVPIHTMRRFERRVETKYGATIMGRDRKMSRQFQDQRCHIGDPKGCFNLILKLRDAAGMHDFISFQNPTTGQTE